MSCSIGTSAKSWHELILLWYRRLIGLAAVYPPGRLFFYLYIFIRYSCFVLFVSLLGFLYYYFREKKNK